MYTHKLISIYLLVAFFVLNFSAKADNLSDLLQKADSLYNISSSDCKEVAKKIEKLAKQLDNKEALAKSYFFQASCYYKDKNYNKSISYFEKELEIREKNSEKIIIAESYYNLGSTCLKLDKNSKAKAYFSKSLSISKTINDKDLIYANHSALYITNEKLSEYKLALESLKYLRNTDIGDYNESVGLYEKKYFEQKQITQQKKKELSTVQQKLGKTKEILGNATTKLKQSEEVIYTLEEDTMRKSLTINSLNFQKILGEQEMKAKQEELKLQQRITYIFIGAFIIILFLLIFLFKLFITKKKINNELSVQKDKVVKQNEEITQSIKYASRIQEAILPSEKIFTEHFVEYFIFFKPKNIVSGDFYFLRKVNEYVVFAAVDCTGHGVPGAFMSMLGVAFLNDIIRKKEVTQANQILNILRDNIKQSLNQTGKTGEQQDGMDMAICVINIKTNELQYSGAHNPLIIIRNNEILEIKADRMPVGVHKLETEFTNHKLNLQKNDQLYIFSDGFQDQISGRDKEKYKSKHFKEFLLQHSNLTLNNQKQALENEFDNWKGNAKQIDDIVIIGVKI